MNENIVDAVKLFAMFFFVGGILRRWIYDQVNNIVLRFVIVSSVVAGTILMFVGENLMKHAMTLGMIIVAIALGMTLDVFLDHITTQKAKERLLKK